MSRQDDLKKLISNYGRRLQKLRENRAIKGINAEPELLIEIEDIEKKIEELQVELKESGLQQKDEAGKARSEELQVLLNKVRNSWIRSGLERSLFNEIQIDLRLEERLGVIDSVWGTAEYSRQRIPQGVKAIDKFDELGDGRTLLILGEPGSGKTTVLLEVARDLIERAERDKGISVPVVFNLSSWSDEKWSFSKWLINEFDIFYNIPRKWSEPWIKNQQLLLLLDGLDEVKKELRESCVNAINQFNKEYGLTEIIVCCRDKAYQDLSHRLRFQRSLFIEPLNDDQIESYLDYAGAKLSGVKAALQTDAVLQELAKTPLMLSVMAISFEGLSASEISEITFEEWQHQLWKRYIDRAFAKKQSDTDYSSTTALHWLRFLAQRLIQESQSIFLIEQIKPNWLKPGVERRAYPVLVGLIAGLIIEWLYGLPLGLMAGQLSFHMLAGLLSGIAIGIFGSLSSEVKLFTAMGLSWSWEKAWKATIPGLLSGPLIALLIWLFGKPLGLVTISLWYYLMIGSITGIVIAVISVAFAGSVASNLESILHSTNDNLARPNQGVWQTAHRATLTTLITLATIILPFALLSVWFLPLSVILGCVSLYAGSLACIQHGTIRFLLWLDGNSPWNYTHFLNASTNRILLKKTGSGYQFVHDLLRKEIARNYDQIKARNQLIPKSSKLMPVFIMVTLIFLLLSVILPMTVNTWKIATISPIFAPRLNQGDLLLVDRIGFRFWEIQRGEIISFIPTDEMKQSGFDKLTDVKQVLGLPGEEIEIVGNKIYIDGKLLQNPHFLVHPEIQNYGLIKVPVEMYLVVVNNPHYYDKKDKFFINLIPKENIVSRVIFRFWPWQAVGPVAW